MATEYQSYGSAQTHMRITSYAYAQSAVYISAPTIYRSKISADGASHVWELISNANDSIGSKNGTENNITYQVGGPFSGINSAYFNGNETSNISFSDGTGMPSGGDSRTVEFWAKTTKSGYQTVIGWGTNSGRSQYVIIYNYNNDIGLSTYFDDPSWAITGNTHIDGNWHHIVIRYSNKLEEVFFDGTYIGSYTHSVDLTTSTASLQIGRLYYADGFTFQGNLSFIAVYPSALSNIQIANHYLGVSSVQVAQAQVSIGNHFYNVHAQSLASILTTYYVVAQSQTKILLINQVVAQANTNIIGVHFNSAQAQVFILSALSINSVFSQAQAQLVTFDIQQFAQAEVTILATYQAYGQAQVQFGTFRPAQSQALIFTESQQYAQACALIGIPVYSLVFYDDFNNRTSANTWGSPVLGDPYIIQSLGYNIIYSVSGGKGRITMPASGDWWETSTFSFGPNLYNYDLYIELQLIAPSTDPDAFLFNYYGVRDTGWQDTGVMSSIEDAGDYLWMDAINTGTSTRVAISPPVNQKNPFAIKIRSLDSTVYAKAWELSSSEPDWISSYVAGAADQVAGHVTVDNEMDHWADTSEPLITEYNKIEIYGWIIIPINYGAANAQVSILATYQAYSQAEVILNQHLAIAQAQGSIKQEYQLFAQSQAFILKSAGYALAQTRIPHILDSYGTLLKNDGAYHLYGMHTSNASPNEEYIYWKDELGFSDSIYSSFPAYASTVTSPVYPEKLGISLGYYRSNRSWVDIPELSTTTWTIEGWFKSPSATNVRATAIDMMFYDASNNISYITLHFGGVGASTGSKIAIFFNDPYGSGYQWYDTGVTYTANTWYYIGITRNGTEFKVYVNGTLKNTITRSTWYSSSFSINYLLIGGYNSYINQYNTFNYYVGLDNIAIYPTTLSSDIFVNHFFTGLQIRNSFAQAQADIYTIVNRYEQVANAIVSILATSNVVAQAQAKLLAFGVSKVAQAQVKIRRTNIIAGALAYSDIYGEGYPSNPTQATDNNVYTSAGYGAGAGGRRDLDWNFNLARPYWIKRITVRYRWRYDGIQEDPLTAERTSLIINGVSYPATSNTQPSDWNGWEWPTSDKTSTFDLGSSVRTGKITLYYTDQEGAHYQDSAELYEIAIWDEMPEEPPSVQGNAQAIIMLGIRQKVSAQAQARIISFGYKQYAQAQTTINRLYSKFAQAQAFLGWLRVAQAQATIFATMTNYAQAQAKLKAFGVNSFAQSLAYIGRTFISIGQTQIAIKQTYPLFLLSPNYAIPDNGASITVDPEGYTMEGIPSYMIDGRSDTYWMSLVDGTGQDITYITIDLGQARTISAYSILPFKYNASVTLQYSTNNSSWHSVLSMEFPVESSDTVPDPRDAVQGFITAVSARYWRLKVDNGGDDSRIAIASFQLGTATYISGTFAQAQVQIGHFAYGQALTGIYPLWWGSANAQAIILQTYQAFGQARVRHIPPHGSANAQAQIIQVYQVYALANVYTIPPTWFGLSLAGIAAYGVVQTGQATTDILTSYYKHFQAQAFITKTRKMGQSQAWIARKTTMTGMARVKMGHLHHALAAASILSGIQIAQSQAYIQSTERKYSQAQVLIIRHEGFGLANTNIITTYIKTALAIFNYAFSYQLAQAEARIVQTYQPVANSKVRIKAVYAALAQAQATFVEPRTWSGNAMAVVLNKYPKTGLAMAWIGSQVFGLAQTRVLAYNVPKVGQAGCYILVDVTVPIGPTSDRQSYLVMYEGKKLPGYATRESMNSTLNIIGYSSPYNDPSGKLVTTNSIYATATFSDYNGLENKDISLTMVVWEQTYAECKVKIQEAATILRSVRGKYGKLYLQAYDKYYLVKPKSLGYSQDATETNKLVEYEINFEAKPWIISNEVYSITGTGTIDTGDRSIQDGGWTPTTITVTGTDVYISGITEISQSTGAITISGAVTDFVVDSDNFWSTDNEAITPKDYGIYVGPGRTIFTVSGATACRIEWQNRYYL